MNRGKIALAIALGLFATGSAAQALPVSYFTTVAQTDWVYSGLSGLRGLGAGNITVAGVSGTVTQAYLYWHGPTSLTNPNANANISFASTPIVGTNIGVSGDNNWGFQNSQAYRADVTSLITGNGPYALANLIKPSVEVNGATLMVFFNDGNPLNNRDVVLFDGNDSNVGSFDPQGWQSSLSGINYTSGTAAVMVSVSDGQDFADENLLLDGTPIISGNLATIFDGNSVPNAGGGVSNGKLWDIHTADVTSFLTPGPNTLNLTTTSVAGDALSLVTVGFDLPAGSAPPRNAIPEPVTGVISMLALAGLGFSATRRRQA